MHNIKLSYFHFLNKIIFSFWSTLWVVVYGFYISQLMKRFKWIHCKSGNTKGNLNLLLIRVWVRKERLHLACVFQRKSLEKYRKSSSPAVHCLHCLESVVFTQSHCIQIALSLTFSLSLSLSFFFWHPWWARIPFS
jgi:hypothetical protein